MPLKPAYLFLRLFVWSHPLYVVDLKHAYHNLFLGQTETAASDSSKGKVKAETDGMPYFILKLFFI